ncbi:MAG: hypothetical protein CMD39_04590 [Gammaproteobacteria bacterium]|nr:hypothetical protein [Gammaproteobacteria bacterium]
MSTGDELEALIRRELHALAHADDPDVARLTEEIRRRHDGVLAVLLYGSYLRGKRDTLLDFYVLVDDLRAALPRGHAPGNRLLPPNVYYVALPAADGRDAVRAKYATMTLAQFEDAMDDFHGYFWSRFTQPAGLVSARSDEVADRVVRAVARAVHTFVARTVPMLQPPFSSESLWQRGFALTYASELRSEQAEGVGSLYAAQPQRFDALLAAYAQRADAAAAPAAAPPAGSGAYRPRGPQPSRGRSRMAWGARRVAGKLLSVARLVKAAGTFDDPLDYLLWKIERHSGIYIEPSERARKHPLLFAWPLLWRLYRRGAFR